MKLRPLSACLLLASGAAADGGILVNELLNANGGGGVFDAGEFVELLLTTDYTAAQLNGLALGDSSSATAAKFSHLLIGNLSPIATNFPAGTIIVVAGVNFAADAAYSPQPGVNGGDHPAWNIVLTVPGPYVTQNPSFPAGTFAFAGSGDVAWVDANDTASNDFDVLHAVAYGGTAGAFATAGGNVVRLTAVPTLATGQGIAFQGSGADFLTPASYAVTAAGTPGVPQGAGNIAFVDALRSPVVPERHWVSEIGGEFATSGDFDGDTVPDLLVVDRATGDVQVGLVQGDGSAVFGEVLSSGVADVSSVAYGDFNSGRVGLALTNPDFNAVNVVSQDRVNSTFPVNAIGPRLLVSLDGGPEAAGGDLVTITSRNDPPDVEQMESWVAQLPSPVGALLESPNQSAPGGQFAFMSRGSAMGGGVELRIHASPFDLSPLTLEAVANSDWFSLYQPHDPGVTWLEVLTYSLVDISFHLMSGGVIDGTLTTTLPNCPARAAPLEPFNDVMRFVVVYKGGAGAEIFAFDGTLPLVSVQSFTSPGAGEDFLNATPVGDGFALLSGPAGGERSEVVQMYGPDGSGGYTPRGSPTALPALPSSSSGNVFALDAELFVASAPRFLGVLRADDWSSAASGLPGTLDVTAEQFAGGSTGLYGPHPVSFVAPPPGSAFAATNQLDPDISVSSDASARGLLAPQIRFSPPPGRYAPRDPVNPDDVLPVVIEGPPVAVLWFRTDPAGAWQPYAGPVPLRDDATLEAYADHGPGQRSPILHGEYLFDDGPLPTLEDPDLNGNGLGDLWEKTFAITDPNADDDGDGADNRSEHDHGTDPRDASSVPSATPGELLLVITGYDGVTHQAHLRAYGPSGTTFRIEWSPNLQPPWTDLTGADFVLPAGGQLDFDDPNATAAKRFYRLVSPPGGPPVAEGVTLLGVLSGPSRVLLRLEGAPGSSHRIDRSTDLASWLTLPTGNAVIPSAGYVEIEDDDPPSNRAFYQAVPE